MLPKEILKYYVILQRLHLGPSAETEPDDRSDGAWKLKKICPHQLYDLERRKRWRINDGAGILPLNSIMGHI